MTDMTTDDNSLSDRICAFAKVLASDDWTSALLAAYNPTGSTQVRYETAKAALVADLTALSRRSHQEGYRLVPVEPTDGWQPIETAPRSAGQYLVYQPRHKIGRNYLDARICLAQDAGYSRATTHWQPLPAAPKEGK